MTATAVTDGFLMSDELGPTDIDFDQTVIGIEEEVGSHTVTAEDIRAYATAIGEVNPLYLDEVAAHVGPHGKIIAPPLFIHTFRLKPGPDPKVRFGTTVFEAGTKIQSFEPIHAGDTITARAKITNVYAKTGRAGTMVFYVKRINYSNQYGHLIMTMDATMVRRKMDQ